MEYAGDILRNLSPKQPDMQSSIFQESKKTIGAGSGRKGWKWKRRTEMGVLGMRMRVETEIFLKP